MPGQPPSNGVGNGYPMPPPVPTQEPEVFTIKVGWRLKDIDYPICLDYFELDYYDTSYNTSGFQMKFERPFRKPKFEFEITSDRVPCEPDMEFLVRAFGFNKKFSTSYWTPPSCIVTTTPPTTTEPPDASTSSGAGKEQCEENIISVQRVRL